MATPGVAGHAAQHPLEVVQRGPNRNPAAIDLEFTNRIFMRPGALLDGRDGPPHAPQGLEVAKHDDRIGQIGDIDGRFHVADQAMLRHCHERRRALAVQILQQLVHMQNE